MKPLTPASGAVFLDARGGDRSLRMSWHSEAGVVVLSLWRGRVCSGSFRLEAAELPRFLEALGVAALSLEEPAARTNVAI